MGNSCRIQNNTQRMELDGPCRWSRSEPMRYSLGRSGSFLPTTASASIAATSPSSISMKGFNMQSHSGSSKTAFMAGFAVLTIGAVAWSGHLFALLALLILPMVFTSTKAPAQRLTVLVCYYAASIWPVMPGATQFFGDNAGLHPLSILILWLVSSLVLTLPLVWLILTPALQTRSEEHK